MKWEGWLQRLLFSLVFLQQRLLPLSVCQVSVIFGVNLRYSSLGEYAENHLILGMAALGIIISAIFGLRAMARIFFGDQSDELSTYEKENKISDLSIAEVVPASLILLPLLFIGLWPKVFHKELISMSLTGMNFWKKGIVIMDFLHAVRLIRFSKR